MTSFALRFLLLVLLVAAFLGGGVWILDQTNAYTNISKFWRHPPGTYKVLEVNDGDTIVVDMAGSKETIRLIGVDTPETHHPSKPVQCYGPEASDFTAQELSGAYVRLEADPESGNRDRYQRLLRYVYEEDGTLHNLELVEQGYGFAVLAFPHTKMKSFIQAQGAAEVAKSGLWSNCTIERGQYLSTAPIGS